MVDTQVIYVGVSLSGLVRPKQHTNVRSLKCDYTVAMIH
jgi:hypothetical protein